MKLEVNERLALLSILPDHDTLDTIKIVHALRQELSFDEEEHKKLKFRKEKTQEKTMLRWVIEAEPNKDIEIGPKAHMIIVDWLKKLDDEGKVEEHHLPLFEKFPSDK